MKKAIKYTLVVVLGLAVVGCSKEESSAGSGGVARSIEDGGHKGVQLWKDGPYWAETNIGAQEPWESGSHFWWGDTIGYKSVESGLFQSFRFSFSDEKVPTRWKDTSTLSKEGWTTAEGVLAPKHDAAHVHWRGNWRMPTKQELEDLCEKCDWERTKLNNVEGYFVRGKGDCASARIFLPCAGYGRGTSLVGADSGLYWSSVPNSNDNRAACYLSFRSSEHRTYSDGSRYWGGTVRPVQGFTK